MANKAAPAGWYPDPQIPNTLRWWDGRAWTASTQPLEPTAPSTVPALQTITPVQQTAGETQVVVQQPVPEPRHRGGLFGGKRDLEEEVAQLRGTLAELGVTERDQLRLELVDLHSEIPALRNERDELLEAVGPLRAEMNDLQTKQKELTSLRSEIQTLQQQKSSLDGEVAELRGLTEKIDTARKEYEELSKQVVETRETAILQEVGIYEYRHPLDDAPAYKARLTGISAQIKDSVKAGTAVQGSTNWTVNGSSREGARMVKEFSKLMLRAYNNEADNAVRSMKPYTLESSIARLVKAKETIVKLGGTMNIRVTDNYHRLRVEELELTADYLAKVAEQKEKDREERARLKEEEIARREFEREQERLRKEQAHYESTLATMREQGDEAAAAELEAKLNEIGDALDGLNRRSANIRAGHVYVISNVGAFGPDMVKIGMTRRLDPMDRVKELGDASVPFHYDVHALIFSDDAVGLETSLHHALADARVNYVNMRREFFRVHPTTVRTMLDGFGATVVEYIEEPEALEWRQSENTRRELLAAQEATAASAGS
jgi:uncharacterized coiled-coil DUF342 family protein